MFNYYKNKLIYKKFIIIQNPIFSKTIFYIFLATIFNNYNYFSNSKHINFFY